MSAADALADFLHSVRELMGVPHFHSPAHAHMLARRRAAQNYATAPGDGVVDWPAIEALLERAGKLRLAIGGSAEMKAKTKKPWFSAKADAFGVDFDVPKKTRVPIEGAWALTEDGGALSMKGSYNLADLRALGGATGAPVYGVINLPLGVGADGARRAYELNLPSCRLHLHIKLYKDGAAKLRGASLLCLQNPRYSPVASMTAMSRSVRTSRNMYCSPSSFAPAALTQGAPADLKPADIEKAAGVANLSAAVVSGAGASLVKYGKAADAPVALSALTPLLNSVAAMRILLGEKGDVALLRTPQFLLDRLGANGAGAVADALVAIYGDGATPTVEQLLLHTAGLPSNFTLRTQQIIDMLLSGAGAATPGDQLGAAATLAKLLCDIKPVAKPGTQHLHSTIGYVILEHALAPAGKAAALVRGELAKMGASGADVGADGDTNMGANWLASGLTLSPTDLAQALVGSDIFGQNSLGAYAAEPEFHINAKKDACPGGWMSYTDVRSGARVLYLGSYVREDRRLNVAVAVPTMRALAVYSATLESGKNPRAAVFTIADLAAAQLTAGAKVAEPEARPAVGPEQAAALRAAADTPVAYSGSAPAPAETRLAQLFGGATKLTDITDETHTVTFSTAAPPTAGGSWVETIALDTDGDKSTPPVEFIVRDMTDGGELRLVNKETGQDADRIQVSSMSVNGKQYMTLETPYGTYAPPDTAKMVAEAQAALSRPQIKERSAAPSTTRPDLAAALAGEEASTGPAVALEAAEIGASLAPPASIGELLVGKHRGWGRKHHHHRGWGRRFRWPAFLAGTALGVGLSPFYGYAAPYPPYYYGPYGYGW